MGAGIFLLGCSVKVDDTAGDDGGNDEEDTGDDESGETTEDESSSDGEESTGGGSSSEDAESEESTEESDTSEDSAEASEEEGADESEAEASEEGGDGTSGAAEESGADDGSGETAGDGDATAEGSGDSGGVDEGRSAGCGSSRTLMNGRRTIQSGGQNRDYILRVPDDYDNNRPYRFIVAYHWLNGSADQVANGGGGGSTEDPYYGLWDLAENSTIFVAPEGLNAGWANNGDRDIAFTDAILEEVLGDLCIDTTRIFATGFSYGGAMSYALACARPEVVRGVAIYAGAQLSGCNGGNTPVAYFHAHGVGDSVLNISQGRPLRDRFVEVNGCTPQNPPEPGLNSGTHICTSYEGCMEGYPVRWCAHGGDHNPTEKDQGQSESWVPPEAWAFISQF